jgi:glycosyltransferase involved in cell wall biosynthesis
MSDPMRERPRVTSVIPCRNEVRYIGPCLESLIRCDYPKDRLEVLVCDGMSDDGTREIVAGYSARHGFIRLVDNPERITPCAMNAGIRESVGDVIMPMGAHAVYSPSYISQLVAALDETGADNVGGVLVTLPANGRTIPRALAVGLSHPFGVGNSYFRIGAAERREVDTVPFGCYRRAVFERIGVFDPELVRNQDDELNARLLKRGGRIVLIPEVVSYYYARGSLSQVARMFYQYGFFKPLAAWKVGQIMTVRQLVPTIFVSALAVTGVLAPWLAPPRLALGAIVGAYAIAAVTGAALTLRKQGVRCAAALLIVFPVLHVSYGLGSIVAVVERLLGRRRPSHQVAAVPLSR